MLELGCGDGANLLPMAFELQGAELVGVDLDRQRVEAGAVWADELGLRNIRLEARDILDIGDEYGKFDYIIAHGVYSWVPSQIRDRLLDLCSKLLNESGVAFVSFNTLPGWHFLQYLRDFAALTRQQGQELAPEQLFKQIRGLAGLFAAEQPGAGGQAAHLRQLLTRLETTTDYMLAFDYLSEVSDAVSLTDFTAHVSQHGLRYLADANYFETSWATVPPRARQAIAKLSPDAIAREAFADHFSARLFRRAVLCPAAASTRNPTRDQIRRFQLLAEPKADNFDPAKLLGDGALSFTMLHGAKLTVSTPCVKVALWTLGKHWPRSLGFDALVSETSAQLRGSMPPEIAAILESAFWDMYCAGAVDLRITPPRCEAVATERPRTSALARTQLVDGDMVTSQHHDFTRIVDALSRELFMLLDGSRDRTELAEALSQLAKSGRLAPLPTDISPSSVREAIEQRLNAWASHALLVPD